MRLHRGTDKRKRTNRRVCTVGKLLNRLRVQILRMLSVDANRYLHDLLQRRSCCPIEIRPSKRSNDVDMNVGFPSSRLPSSPSFFHPVRGRQSQRQRVSKVLKEVIDQEGTGRTNHGPIPERLNAGSEESCWQRKDEECGRRFLKMLSRKLNCKRTSKRIWTYSSRTLRLATPTRTSRDP